MLTAHLLVHLLREAHLLRVEAHLLKESIAVPARIVIAVGLGVASAGSSLRREALEQSREREDAGQALVRYVQLNKQCSEEAAYQRIASFVKKHVPLDDHSFIERMLAHERQSLVALVQELIVHDPDEIDEI